MNTKKKVCFLLADGAEETEVVTPVDLLRRAGVEVTLAGVRLADDAEGLSRTSHGLGLAADVAFDGDIDGFDMVVVPGGMRGVQNLLAADEVADALRDAHARGIWVAAICAGPWVPAKAGVLGQRPYTCYPGCQGEIDGGTNWQDRPVVIDAEEKVLTSQAAGTAIPFALSIIEVLCGRPAADQVAAAIVWTPSAR